MLNSPCRIWIHAMFATGDNRPLITTDNERLIFAYIKEQFTLCGCECRRINGTQDHVHVLFHMNYKMAITDILKTVKGSTSHWINANELTSEKFSWQKGFSAFSHHHNDLDDVEWLIANQKMTHFFESYEEEHARILLSHGLIPESGKLVSRKGEL